MPETPKPTNVYAKIAAVQGELAKVGIAKEGNNAAQGYKFRGIDQVYGTLSPLLAKHGLCVLPRIIEREMHERVTIKEWNGQKKESVLFYVTVTAEFDFVSADDGSTHTVRTYGEAMDSGDKATNKAMSAAYKYAALMTFAIPTEGDNDADATTHEVAPKQDAKRHVEPVSDSEWMIVTDLIEKTGTDAKAFCKAFKIASVKQLAAADFDKARGMLNKKLAAMAPPPAQGFDVSEDEVLY